jgi:putative redox protein
MSTRATVKTGPDLPSRVEMDSGITVTFDQASGATGRDLEGPSSTAGVSAALASCTAITLNIYASRKQWDLTGLGVSVETEYEGPNPKLFRVEVTYPGHLDEEQVERLERIATRCPVHRLLSEETSVEVTTV